MLYSVSHLTLLRYSLGYKPWGQCREGPQCEKAISLLHRPRYAVFFLLRDARLGQRIGIRPDPSGNGLRHYKK